MTAWQIAIETSGRQGSVALLEKDRPVRQIILPPEQRTAESLAPAVAELLAVPPGARRDIGLVSVAVGPGSFTGLRIGVTAAKSLAWALGTSVAACDTLAVIIEQVRREVPGRADEQIDAAINAYRGQVYCRRETRDRRVIAPSQARDRSDWFADLQSPAAAGTLLLAGDAWAKLDPPEQGQLADAPLWQPLATTVGLLGWELHQRDDLSDPMRLLPVYLRASAAEETLNHNR